MKVKDFLEMLNKASEDAEIKIENDKVIITEPKPIEYKFKIGDKVYHWLYKICEVDRCFEKNNEPYYHIKYYGIVPESDLEPYIHKDITERIKTFEDAYDWCRCNGKEEFFTEPWHENNYEDYDDTKDIDAYLQLRIITVALNEGWEPKFEEREQRWHVEYDLMNDTCVSTNSNNCVAVSNKLTFKSEKLANYAAKQFCDIYVEFYR